jgi:hypothetical protein
MYIDKFKEEDVYCSEDGCEYDTAEDFIQCEVLGFCGCGNPECNLKFIMDGLKHINSISPSNRSNFDEWYQQWYEEGLSFFGSEGARYFFFYWAAKEGFTEHGSSVPGWLTEKGNHLLSDLAEIYNSVLE